MLATIELELGQWDFDEQKVESDTTKDYYPWTGRGWVQFTYRASYQRVAAGLRGMDKFKGQDVDILANKDLAKDPEIAYTILVQGMTQGWFERYRINSGGGCGLNNDQCTSPIVLGDFVNSEKTDYLRARAVINANCTNAPCNDVQYEGKGFMPTPDRLTHQKDDPMLGPNSAKLFETLLCKAMGKSE
jgi:hypothetical protein